MKKIHVVALGFRGFPAVQGGIENHCENLYPRLVDLGCSVTVLARAAYVGKKPYEYKGVSIQPLYSPKSKIFETILHTTIASYVAKKMRPDLVHFHAIGPSLLIPSMKFCGIKTVATHHGFDYNRKKWGAFARKVLKHGERQLSRADAVISVSSHISKHLEQMFSCVSHTIFNGVYLPRICEYGSYCKKWELKKREYFFFAGRIVPEKCIDELIEAFSILSTDWKLVIAGSADHEDSYSKHVKRLGTRYKNVVLTGFVNGEELAELFSNAGGFVLPSSHEGLPIVLLEALSYGLPCIVSNIDANREVSSEYINYFPVHDIQCLAHSMQSLVSRKWNYDLEKVRSTLQREYDWDTIAQRTLQVYRSVLRFDD